MKKTTAIVLSIFISLAVSSAFANNINYVSYVKIQQPSTTLVQS